jgi:dynactin complex subunit
MDMPDATIIAGVSAIIGAMLTFISTNRDSVTKANTTAVDTLTKTINALETHIDTLNNRVSELENQITSLMSENISLARELHEHRKTLALYQRSQCDLVEICDQYKAPPRIPVESKLRSV